MNASPGLTVALYSGCKKYVLVFLRFFRQSLRPQFRHSKQHVRKLYNARTGIKKDLIECFNP
jgi:hypothetical protein